MKIRDYDPRADLNLTNATSKPMSKHKESKVSKKGADNDSVRKVKYVVQNNDSSDDSHALF